MIQSPAAAHKKMHEDNFKFKLRFEKKEKLILLLSCTLNITLDVVEKKVEENSDHKIFCQIISNISDWRNDFLKIYLIYI